MKPAVGRPGEKRSFPKSVLEAIAVIGIAFVAAAAALALRVLATAHAFPPFHDTVARLLPFLD
jgi:hypothetical protein